MRQGQGRERKGEREREASVVEREGIVEQIISLPKIEMLHHPSIYNPRRLSP